MNRRLIALLSSYERFILLQPRKALAVLIVLLGFFSYHARDFELDASAESLLLDDDRDLQLSREVDSRYQTRELLVVTFTPRRPLFSDAALSQLAQLRNELRRVPGVHSVTSVLDVPLVKSSDVPLLQMASDVQTLESPAVDRERALAELTESPIFRDLIISGDQRTTALLIHLERVEAFSRLLVERNELLIQRGMAELDPEQERRLEEVTLAYEVARDALGARNHETISRIRSIIDSYRTHGILHLGGVPMIADDMLRFIRNDLIVFGACVFVFLVFVLTLIFRRIRWVVLPVLCCFYASMVMLGLLGLMGWEVTVISSNFLALMLIITISMNIHLAVRYTQLSGAMPGASQAELVTETLKKMVWPCLYTALTTIIGFGSLVFSGIKPVRDFGWMMSAGLAVAFLTSFTVFPAVLVLLRRLSGERRGGTEVPVTERLASMTERHGAAILIGSAVLAVLSAVGISRLTVENSFIDYFSQDTEIYKGMKLIDDKLGGTTPLEVLVRFGGNSTEPDGNEAADAADEDDFLDDFLDAPDPAYWFTPYKIDRIKQVHDLLDRQQEVGKVLSLASIIRIAEDLNDGEELDGIQMSVLYNKLPDEVREPLIHPYVSFEQDEARILLRILDSREDLRRAELLEKIQRELHGELGLGEDDVALAGMLVLYNNMLQSLFSSQISSIGAVMAGITAMFLVLFRSLRLAIIGIAPNLLAAGMVLGLMGWLGIPLDLMTITIAAITIGIAVDHGIHYIYRFREELPAAGSYLETLRICHASIGRAVFYTSTTVIFGFSILVLSNFLPTIYFGVFTGLAMLMAFLAALTLLPKLILVWRPFR